MENPTNPSLVNDRPKVTKVKKTTKVVIFVDPVLHSQITLVSYIFDFKFDYHGYEGDFWVKLMCNNRSKVLNKFTVPSDGNDNLFSNLSESGVDFPTDGIFEIKNSGEYDFEVSVSITDKDSGYSNPYTRRVKVIIVS